MARIPLALGRRAGAIGLVLTTWDVWRRIPPEHRRRLIAATRKHGPTVARLLNQQLREYRRRKR